MTPIVIEFLYQSREEIYFASDFAYVNLSRLHEK